LALIPTTGLLFFCRHCEERSDEAIHSFFAANGLLRFARNDAGITPAVTLRVTPE
jgi:hypothetical protein